MGLDNAATMASPSPVPFCLVVLRSEAEGAAALFLGHALAGVLEFDQDMVGAALLRGRRTARVEMVSEPPSGMASTALSVRFRKACASCVPSAMIVRQVGGQAADELNLLVAQFVPDEQGQIVQQLIDVDRAQLRFGAARKIQDLFDDLVQVLHFLAQDGVVLDARIARAKIPGAASGRAFSSP